LARRRISEGGSPISLFSFQDIITCITGIMIMLVLLLILDVITKTEMAAKAEHLEPDVSGEDLPETEPLQKQLEELRRDIEKNGKILEHSALADTANVAEEITNADQRISEGRQKARQIREKRKSAKKRLEQIPDIRKRHKEQSESIGRIEGEVGEVRKRQSKNEERIEGEIAVIRGEIEATKSGKKIFYVPAVRENKQAILVQCTENSIKVQPIDRSEKVKTFASFDQFTEYTKKRNKGREYFVILVKPDGIDFFIQIRDGLHNSGFDMGYEPLEQDKEAVFDEE